MPGPRKVLAPPQTTQVTPFTSHSSHRASLVFHSADSIPHPFNHTIYFTHPSASPETIDAAEFLDLLRADSPRLDDPDSALHLKLYYLPDATDTECISHWKAELTRLGDTWAQITAFNLRQPGANPNALPFPSLISGEASEQIPGLITDHRRSSDLYNSRLYKVPEIIDAANTNSRTPVFEVMFDPISQDEYDVLIPPEDRDENEPDELPEMKSFELRLLAPGPEEGLGDGRPSLGDRLADDAFRALEKMEMGRRQHDDDEEE